MTIAALAQGAWTILESLIEVSEIMFFRLQVKITTF